MVQRQKPKPEKRNPMQLFYVSIHRKIEYSTYAVNETYYFNSEKSMKEWIKNFRRKKYTLQKITDKGKAYFNEYGILCP